jgi:hypothetical protein
MKRILFAIIVVELIAAFGIDAKEAEIKQDISAWSVLEPLGLREPATVDTLQYNYYRNAIPSAASDAWATTGNLGAEGINMIYTERKATSDFFFRDGLQYWMPSLSKMKFYNTKIPMTLMSYNTSGGRENAQDRLQMDFSGNINKRAQFGAKLDYLYSKGSYSNQSTKDLTWGFSGSYIGDRYEFQGFFNHYNLLNKENGGITDDLYITDPAEIQGGVSSIDPKSIPTNLSNAHTRLIGQELYLNHRYKFGYWHEEREGDSVKSRTYIPVSSVIWTMKYNSDKHLFVDKSSSEISKYFENTYLDNSSTFDKTSYWTLTNTVGLSLLEGFHKYAKFGLAAYITHQVRNYQQMADTLDRALAVESGLTAYPEGITSITPKETQQLAWVGGQLTKQKGSILTYEATAQFGILGPVAGDVEINGRVSTHVPMFGDTVSVTGYGSFKNEEAPYLMKNYISNHFIWQNDFGKIRTTKFGGRLDIPFSRTAVDVSVENVQNYTYFGADFLPVQYGSNVQVFSARLRQNFKVGILHWDNVLTYQTSSEQSVIPLPKFAVYSNLYLWFHIATLKVQFGVDCDYYTKYYGLAYQPATASFAVQNEMKVGNYPFMNAYFNFKLRKARFYVMMSHVNQGLFGGNNYFALPHYPLNPRRFQIGLSVDLAN